MRPVFRALLAVVLLSGCVSVRRTIDASSDEAFIKSVNEIRGKLSASKRRQFEEALVDVAAGSFTLEELFASETGADQIKADVMKKFHGKSAGQVIRAAKKIARQSLKKP